MKKIILCAFCVILITAFVPLATGAANVNVRVNGNLVQDPVAQIIDGRTVVGLRAVFEALGFEVGWNDSTRTATMTRGSQVVSATIGDTALVINGTRFYPDVPPRIINDSFVLPLRAIAEATGSTVDWNGAANEVIILNQAETPTTQTVPETPVASGDFAPFLDLVGKWEWDASSAFFFDLKADGTGSGTGGISFTWGVRGDVLRMTYGGTSEEARFELNGDKLVLLSNNILDDTYYTRVS